MIEKEKNGLKIGLLAADPLREIGLQAIFEDRPEVSIVSISLPGAFREADVNLLVIDTSYTDQIFELLTSFRRLRSQIRIIVMGSSMEFDYIERVIGAGARGYLHENSKEADIRMAIELVQDGSVWAPRKVISRLLDASSGTGRRNTADEPPEFTRRERQVLELLTAGRSNREIGLSLEIDEGTVKAHVGRLMRKVGVANRIALTMYAMEKVIPVAGGKKRF